MALIAGGGDLPVHVHKACQQQGIDIAVAKLAGFGDPRLPEDFKPFGLGEFGRLSKSLKGAGCDAICFAGTVSRPDLKTLVPDWGGVKLLPGAIAAARSGDDALLSYIVGSLEKQGFTIVPPQQLCQPLLAPAGPLGALTPDADALTDGLKAMEVALKIGAMDIGQGAVICDGLVLAVEAQEGTDRMLERVAKLPGNIRGTAELRRGVLAKVLKPGQERRLDLPTIGRGTIRRARDAGMAGICLEAEAAFILNRDEVIAMADEAGLFVYGFTSDELPQVIS